MSTLRTIPIPKDKQNFIDLLFYVVSNYYSILFIYLASNVCTRAPRETLWFVSPGCIFHHTISIYSKKNSSLLLSFHCTTKKRLEHEQNRGSGQGHHFHTVSKPSILENLRNETRSKVGHDLDRGDKRLKNFL